MTPEDSETPRTDAVHASVGGAGFSYMAMREHANELERELSAAQPNAERYRWLFEDNGNGVMDRVNRVWRQWNGLFKDWDAAVDAAIKESGK